MNTTNTAILGVCLLVSALIVALPGLSSMRREHGVRQDCETIVAAVSPKTRLAIEGCVTRIIRGTNND